MALPTDFNTVTVSGTYVTVDGAAATGSVTFTADTRLRSAATKTSIIPGTVQVALSQTGTFTVELPATNDPDISPSGWAWRVEERFGNYTRSYSMLAPLGAPIDLTNAAPVAAPGAAVQLITTVAGHGPDVTGDVALVKADVGLSNVDNTADATKPISTAQAAALAAIKANVQYFTASGTWTKPAGAKTVHVTLIGGGGGGGSGRRGVAASVRCGGGGGAGGGITSRQFDATDLPATSPITIGAGGAGGVAVTVDDTSGNAGTGGSTGLTFFGITGNCLCSGYVGGGGGGGTAAAGAGGVGGFGSSAGGAGGTASTTGLIGGASPTSAGACGGGSGGGITVGNVAAGGGTGGTSLSGNNAGAGVGGVVDTTAPTSGTSPTIRGTAAGGAGGGAASITTVAQAGAVGGAPGGGGGGGGASVNGFASGAGGAGAPGSAVVITYF